MSKKNRNRASSSQRLQSSFVPQIDNKVDHQKKLMEAYRSGENAIKAIDKRLRDSVPKGVQYDWLNNSNYNNVVYGRDKIPDRLLRLIERRNPVVGAGTTLRIQQGIEYSNISHDKDIPGWEIVLKDEKEAVNRTREKQKAFLEEFIRNGCVSGYTSFNLTDSPSTFRERMSQFMRDRTLIDKICWEMERDRKGRAVALWVLDGATIFPVLPGGFYGASSMITTGLAGGYSKLSDAIRKARVEGLPPIEEIAYVQELLYGMSGGGIAAAFRNIDLIYDIANDLNDIRYYKQGFSDVEKANVAITAFINSLSYNSNGLSRGSIPKVAIAMGENSSYTTEQLEDLQDEWMANFEGVDGQWNIPLLNSNAKILNLMPNNRDMEYQAYMEFCGSLICATMGFDPAEAGLRFNQAQNILSENTDGKQKFSKNRGLCEKLGAFKYITDRFIELTGYEFSKDWCFRFNGLTSEDKNFEADLRKKAVETDTTINELRKAQGNPPLEHGDIILNPQYIQYIMQKEQADAQQDQGASADAGADTGFSGFGEDDIDSAVNDAVDSMDMNKAVSLI
jgi:hypothetical protein